MQVCTICSSNVIVKNELRKYKIKKEELLRNEIKSDKTNTKWWGKQSDYKWEIWALVTGGTAVLPNIIRKLFKKETSEAGVSQETLQMFLRTPAWISDEKKNGCVGRLAARQASRAWNTVLAFFLSRSRKFPFDGFRQRLSRLCAPQWNPPPVAHTLRSPGDEAAFKGRTEDHQPNSLKPTASTDPPSFRFWRKGGRKAGVVSGAVMRGTVCVTVCATRKGLTALWCAREGWQGMCEGVGGKSEEDR